MLEMTEKKRRSPITFRLNPEQEQQVRTIAKKQGISLSKLIKNSLLGTIDNDDQTAA